jgi:exosortase
MRADGVLATDGRRKQGAFMSSETRDHLLASSVSSSGGEILAWRRMQRTMLAGAAAILLLAVGFSGTFRSLWGAWRDNPNYSHGVLILPISLFLVWRMRREIASTKVVPSWWGIGVVALGVLLQIVGLRGDVTIFQGWAFLLVLAGLVWSWFGWSMLVRVRFPLAFLLFMVPILPVLMNVVSFRLKVLAADGAVRLASALGAPVVQRGMELYFPSGILTVENACSGLNSLVALMALGALFGHMASGSGWKAWTLFLLSIPVAIAANVVRITSLAVMAAVTDTETASGVFHDVGGFLLFGVALLLLFGLRKALRW